MTAEPDQPAEYGLVMPFLPVKSRGGPHDDDAYVAGFEMGRLDCALALRPKTPLHMTTIRTDNVEQADLIAMNHGFRCSAERSPEYPEWTYVVFAPVEGEGL